MNKKTWYYGAVAGLIISILSFFISVVYYVDVLGTKKNLSILDIIFGTEKYKYLVEHYHGPIVLDLGSGFQVFLSLLAIGALACSIIGLYTLKAQRPNTKQFNLTILGFAGVAIPAIVAIACVLMYGKYYYISLHLGVAPIVTPITMVLCIIAVMRRKNKMLEELREEMERKGLIRQGGDL